MCRVYMLDVFFIFFMYCRFFVCCVFYFVTLVCMSRHFRSCCSRPLGRVSFNGSRFRRAGLISHVLLPTGAAWHFKKSLQHGCNTVPSQSTISRARFMIDAGYSLWYQHLRYAKVVSTTTLFLYLDDSFQ